MDGGLGHDGQRQKHNISCSAEDVEWFCEAWNSLFETWMQDALLVGD